MLTYIYTYTYTYTYTCTYTYTYLYPSVFQNAYIYMHIYLIHTSYAMSELYGFRCAISRHNVQLAIPNKPNHLPIRTEKNGGGTENRKGKITKQMSET